MHSNMPANISAGVASSRKRAAPAAMAKKKGLRTKNLRVSFYIDVKPISTCYRHPFLSFNDFSIFSFYFMTPF